MGNGKSKTTKSVDRTSATAVIVDWKNDSYINHLIVAGRLAPKGTDNSENREAECPICFLNFEYLNTVVCCKQAICTGCVVQLKRASTTSSCPFCSEKSLTVSFSRSRRISEPGVPPPVYTTPEQDKLRSMSSDEIHVSPVTKQSREELERQISTQRLMYHDPDEESRVFAQAGVRRPRAVTTSSLRNRSNHSEFNNHSPTRGASGSSSSSTSSRMNQRHSNYQSTSSPTRGLGGDPNILSSLRTILGPSQLDQINSIEELEELMLLEAIRQSQNEASSTTVSSTLTPVAPSVPSPSHHSPSSRRHRKSSHQHGSRSQQLLGDFRDSQMSNSVSSSGSNRLDSGSEGNKSNSQLSEMEVAGAMHATENNNGSSSGGGSSSSSSSTGSGGGSTRSPNTNNAMPESDVSAARAVMASAEEEEDLYDEELELALQLSMMSATSTMPKKLLVPPPPGTVQPSSKIEASASSSAAAAVEEANSKMSAEESEEFSDFVTAPPPLLQQVQDQKTVLPKSLEVVQADNDNWLNAFESELSMGMMVKSAEGQPTSGGNNVNSSGGASTAFAVITGSNSGSRSDI